MIRNTIYFLILIQSIFTGCKISDTNQDPSGCGSIKVSNVYRPLILGANGGCYYVNSNGNNTYVDRSLCTCSNSSASSTPTTTNSNRTEVLITKSIYTISYNELYEQPNWITYISSNRPKLVDRGSMDFHLENGIHTSDDADYANNEYDKGHLAPAASFSDTYDNLYQTFSYVNCTMQKDDLNRTEWAQLETQERNWTSTLGDISVKIELIFNSGHEVRSTGVHVPSGFKKSLTFKDGSKKCYYFPNVSPTKNWDQYQISCN